MPRKPKVVCEREGLIDNSEVVHVDDVPLHRLGKKGSYTYHRLTDGRTVEVKRGHIVEDDGTPIAPTEDLRF